RSRPDRGARGARRPIGFETARKAVDAEPAVKERAVRRGGAGDDADVPPASFEEERLVVAERRRAFADVLEPATQPGSPNRVITALELGAVRCLFEPREVVAAASGRVGPAC